MNVYIGFEDRSAARVVGMGWWEGHLAGSFTARHTSGFSLHRPTLHPTAIHPDQRTFNATAGDGKNAAKTGRQFQLKSRAAVIWPDTKWVIMVTSLNEGAA